MRALMAIFLLVGLSACSTPGTLNYTPQQVGELGPKAVAGVIVLDRRDEKPNRVATIRGGHGNPLKVLDTTEPVATVVQAVITKALDQRQMLAAGGPYRFQVTLNTLYGDQFMGRKAELKMDLAVLDRTNQTIYADTIAAESYAFTFFDNGIFAGIEALRTVVEKLLSTSVEKMLDKPALRQALAAPPRVLLER
ncbi:MAG: YajG family lipoprotein [Janthinobacterium lividum]